MLSIKINDTVFSCAMFHQHIQHIAYKQPITFLPLISSPITGLINFHENALLQINVAQALKLEKKNSDTEKLLIINTSQGSFALCVDDVLNITHPKQNLPELSLTDIIPKHLKTKPIINFKSTAITQKKQKITVLLVNTSGKTIALLANNIERIQEKTDLKSTNADLTHIKNNLLPNYSLGQLLGFENNTTEDIALIVRGVKTSWALLVHRVIAIETISEVYSSGLEQRDLWCVNQQGEICQLIDTTQLKIPVKSHHIPRLWYITAQGKIQELIDANHLLESTETSYTITINQIEPYQDTLNKKTADLIINGISIVSHSETYFLPLTIATRALNPVELPKLTKKRFSSQTINRQQRIPCIDSSKLLFNQTQQTAQQFVEVILLNKLHFLLSVDKVILSKNHYQTEQWLTFDFPYPINLLFDAVYYDEQSKHWILKVKEIIKFSDLSWTMKKTVINAVIGWFDK